MQRGGRLDGANPSMCGGRAAAALALGWRCTHPLPGHGLRRLPLASAAAAPPLPSACTCPRRSGRLRGCRTRWPAWLRPPLTRCASGAGQGIRGCWPAPPAAAVGRTPDRAPGGTCPRRRRAGAVVRPGPHRRRPAGAVQQGEREGGVAVWLAAARAGALPCCCGAAACPPPPGLPLGCSPTQLPLQFHTDGRD